MQDPKSRQKSPSGHHPTTLPGYISVYEAADRPQMLPTGNVGDRYAAFHRVLWTDCRHRWTVAQSLYKSKLSVDLYRALHCSGMARGVARNLFFFGRGINFYCTILQSYTLTSSAAIIARNNFHWLILGYIYRYTPRRYGPGYGTC